MKNCKRHPKYKAIRKPSPGCARCRAAFIWRRVLKFLGFQVTVRTNRKPPTVD